MTLTKKDIKTHYNRPEIRNTIIRVSTDGNTTRSGHWQDLEGDREIQDWYRRVSKQERYKYCMGSRADYTNMVMRYRTIYWTLNMFNDRIYKENYAEISTDQSPAISRKYTAGYSLGIDIDKTKGNDIHSPECKKAVEDMGQYFSNALREYLPNSVYCLYSGGGMYLLIHHKALDKFYSKYLNNPKSKYSWDYMFRVLGDAFDIFIKDKEHDFFAQHPEHKDIVKADALNNSQRVFKCIYSIHKKLDYAVVPLDPLNVKIDFDRASLPLQDDVIGAGNKWYSQYDKGGAFLTKCLAPYLQAAIKKKGKEIIYADNGSKKSDVPIDDIEKWPPCMKNLYNLPSCGEGATRALAAFASFLWKIGIEDEQASEMFFSLAERWQARTSNLFDSYYTKKKMNVPTCRRLRSSDKTAFPKGVSIRDLNVCVPDFRCTSSFSPYYYANPKAREQEALPKQ